MFQSAGFLFLGNHGDEIESHSGIVEFEMPDIGIGRVHNTSDFLVVHRIGRASIEGVLAGFDFHKDQHIVLFRHDVQFLVATPPVAVQQRVALVLQELCSPVFPFFSLYVMKCHTPFSANLQQISFAVA